MEISLIKGNNIYGKISSTNNEVLSDISITNGSIEITSPTFAEKYRVVEDHVEKNLVNPSICVVPGPRKYIAHPSGKLLYSAL